MSRERGEHESCLTCAAFSYCDPEDVDEADGYCCHANNANEYGGSWTESAAWCDWWTTAGQTEIAARMEIRAAALKKVSAGAADQREGEG